MKEILLKRKTLFLSLTFLLFAPVLFAQKYEIDASNVMLTPVENLYKMGNPGPAGKEIKANTQYITIGGKPVLPVMGEVQFSRMVPWQWEETILKMKACGINIIATYLFWNHHEEIEGQFEWENSNNIRAFIELCKKHNVYCFPRLGPWSHGEARFGGTPDWILSKEFVVERSFDPVYQHYAERYLREIAAQFEGLYYKDGGPIIGVQMENEYNKKREGEAYIMWLKGLIQKLGIDVPFYTCTNWGGSIPLYEVLGVSGTYGEESWSNHIERTLHYFTLDYLAEERINANKIQRENLPVPKYPDADYGKYRQYYPTLNAELGVGMQNFYHRRFSFDPVFPLVIPFRSTATGAALLGYYVFTGSTQMHGQLHSTNETRGTGYPDQLPTKSYDFIAAIRESGEITEGYKNLKRLHYFLNEYGGLLAPMVPNTNKNIKYIESSDLETYGRKDVDAKSRYIVRSDNNSGFLFGCLYTRFTPPVEGKPKFKIKFQNEIIELPAGNITLPDGSVFIWPLNFDMNGCKIKYATAQLLNSIGDYCFFHQNGNIDIEFALDNSNIAKVTCKKATVSVKNGICMITNIKSGKDCIISIAMKDGTFKNIVVLTEKEASDSWIFTRNNKKELFITEANMYEDNNDIYIYSGKNQMSGYQFVNQPADDFQKPPFVEFSVNTSQRKPEIKIEPYPIMSGAKWLETANFKKIGKDSVLLNRSFLKEFSLENPSKIKKATLYLYPEADCFIQINDIRVNDDIEAEKLNVIDITGYAKKGDNQMILNFPFTPGEKKMSARLTVEYENFDRFDLFSDHSWLTADVSSFLKRRYSLPPVITAAPEYAKDIKYKGFEEWNIVVPNNVFDGLNNIYFHFQYIGDRAELYNGYMLVADDFNNNTYWGIGLNKLEKTPSGKTLRLVVYPLSPKSKIFFDNPPRADEYNIAGVKSFEVINEYKAKLDLIKK